MSLARKIVAAGIKGLGQEPNESDEASLGVLAPAGREWHAERSRDEVARKVMYRPETLPDGRVWATKGVWAAVLSEQEYACLREHKMGAPLSSQYVNFTKKKCANGAFCCKGCGLEVFAVSDYLSDVSLREGYPAFSRTMPANVDKRFQEDNSMMLFCTKCDSFLGRSRPAGFAPDGGIQMVTTAASHSLVLKKMSSIREETLLKDREREARIENGLRSPNGLASLRSPKARMSGQTGLLSPRDASKREISSPGAPSGENSGRLAPKASGRLGALSPPRLSGHFGSKS
eukprot:CAMPEP_0185829346 /NCGR_PEP_ID=MMETSP1353-20130828/194_1 /TAXON_ID=1077150 /ORGANISM="Erythrolobus australicus, Strain CCMP3124" /LENGTH=287 /DNA_ID=CAMNT_0028527127 /DNA_START=167 /DNA_END=1030 /DNA_ORIENTATION=+